MALDNQPMTILLKNGIMSFSRGEYDGYHRQHVSKKNTQWIPWYGPRNDEPNDIMSLVLENNLNQGILKTKVDFIVGRGIKAYKQVVDSATQKRDIQLYTGEWDQWLVSNEFDDIARRVATDLMWFNNAFVEVIKTNDGRVYSVRHVDATTVRSGAIDNKGIVRDMYVCHNWAKPIYDTKNPNKDNVIKVAAWHPGCNETKFIIHLKEYVPGYPYYPPPSWIGCRDYINLANQIPAFHASALRNGYHLKYHIVVPQGYLDGYEAKERAKVKAELREQMDAFLSGTTNAGKAFISFAQKLDGQTFEEWKIIPLENKLNDSAYTMLFAQTNTAIISGHGIDPTLCGIETQGKLSSGSEKRIAAQIHQSWKTVIPRSIILKVLKIVKGLNQWPDDLLFAFEDTEITTLEKNPMGTQQTVAQ
jgi:capsid portal protein